MWEVTTTNRADVNRVLEGGWEPFAVTMHPDRGTVIWLRRLTTHPLDKDR